MPYCPVEAPLAKAEEGSSPSEGPSCEQASVKVKNESGMTITVFWIDEDGREVSKRVCYRRETDQGENNKKYRRVMVRYFRVGCCAFKQTLFVAVRAEGHDTPPGGFCSCRARGR